MATSFNGTTFKERVTEGMLVLGFSAEANIDAQPTGTTVSFDVGDPGPRTIELEVRCTAAQLTALRAAARAGTQGTLVLNTETCTAVAKACTNVRRHTTDTDKWLCTLTFWSQ